MYEALTLKKSNCKNCYKCIRHCPVKAIRFSENQAHILTQDCILCGQCFVYCPQNAKEITNDTGRVKKMIKDGEKVIASLAPSFIADFDNVGIDSMRDALKKLGFYDAEETAIGATIVKREYERLVNEGNYDNLITSCCHTVNLLIQKYYPELTKYLADVLSPMQAHCQDIKRRHPDAKVVFIGPCVSKKDEADRYPGYADVVLTFEELAEMFDEKNIVPEEKLDSTPESLTRFFPTTGGILKTLTDFHTDYTYMAIDGVKNCRAALDDMLQGNISHCFIEMSACSGSCINGPVMKKYHRNPVRDYQAIAKYAGDKDFDVQQPEISDIRKIHHYTKRALVDPSEEEIKAALKSMGKTKPTDELNCGTCGYETCREKAIAICRGVAESFMCLPYLMTKSESFSSSIITNSPYGVIVVNNDLTIQQVNPVGLDILKRSRNENYKGLMITELLPPDYFLDVLDSKKVIQGVHMHLSEIGRHISATFTYDKDSDLIIALFQDITKAEQEKAQKEAITKKTVETADALVAKQMRIVQEIASLLGETTAETKIALTKLKETVQND